jgi:hypothetical protein
MREFFEYFNLPQGMRCAGVEHEICLVGRVATLHELGFSIDVKNLKESQPGKSSNRCKGCAFKFTERCYDAKNENGRENRHNANGRLAPLNPTDDLSLAQVQLRMG